ncbi:hypothetical protein D3C77_690750 [compost metagenome]
MVSVDPVDQANTLSLVGLDVAPGVGQLTQDAIANNPRQALQGADISGHAHVDFLDRELGIGAAVAHVAG